MKNWRPNGMTVYKFHVTIAEGVTISIRYYGSSLSASRIRSSQLIRASNTSELKKLWKIDVETGVQKFLRYQKKHGKKITVGRPEVRGTPHYAFVSKDAKKIVHLPNKKLPDGVYIDNSPAKTNPKLSEFETENEELAESIDQGLRNALMMPDYDTRIKQIESDQNEQNELIYTLLQKYNTSLQENAELRARITALEQSSGHDS